MDYFVNQVANTDPNLSYWTTGAGEVLFNFVQVTDVDYNVIYPMHTSAAPTNNQFSPNTKWQLLTINNKYLYYTDDNTNIKVTDAYQNTDAYLWAFHINENGSTIIYNKAAGPTKVLAAGAMTGQNGGGTCPRFVEANNIPEGQIAEWNGAKSFSISGKDGFFLYRGDNYSEKMNLRNVDGTDCLSFWTAGANEGSTFWIVPYVNYTLTCQDESGKLLNTPAETFGIGGSNLSLPRYSFMKPVSVMLSNNEPLSIEDNNIILPEIYGSQITVTYQKNIPFETTTIENGTFAADTKWYTLSIHSTNKKRYLKAEENKTVPMAESNPFDDSQLWCFTGSVSEGIKVYNKAMGTSVCLNYSDNNTVPFGDDASVSSWTVTDAFNAISTELKEKGFCLKQNGKYINYTYSEEGGTITYWSSNDDGSGIIAINMDDAIADVTEKLQSNLFSAVGFPDFETYSIALEAFKQNPCKETYDAVIKAAANKTELIPGKTYRILGAVEKQYIYANNDAKLYTQEAITGAGQIITFEMAEENTYNIKLQGQYIAKTTTNNNLNLLFGLTKDNESKGTFQLVEAGTGKGIYRIKNTNSGKEPTYLWKEFQKLVGWSGTGNGSQWYIIPANTIDVTISDAGYATINYPFAVELPAGLSAYTGTVNENKVMLNEVSGSVIPANSPVILAGDADIYTLTILAENTEESLTSDLEGTLLPQTIDATTTVYVLAKPEAEEVGFYLLESGEEANRTIGANKAYLTVTAPAGIKAFTFDFGGTTGIENTEAVTEEAEEYYDLQGRRVQNPTKGIYITKSGKKVLFTK